MRTRLLVLIAIALVLTGVGQRSHLTAQPFQPDLVLENLSELIEILDLE